MADAAKDKLAKFFGVQDRLGAGLFWSSIIVGLANIVVTANFVLPRWRQLRFLRLHYTVALGIDWVDDWRFVLIFPAAALVVILINGWLAGRLASRQRRLGYMVQTATVAIEIFVAAGLAIAVSLNG